MTKKELLTALRSKRILLAYVTFGKNYGVYAKQSKAEWMVIVNTSDCDDYDVILTDLSIYIN